jgi:hypothetical protein
VALWALGRAHPVGGLDQTLFGCFSHECTERARFVWCVMAALVHELPYVIGRELLPGSCQELDRCAGVGFPVRVSVAVDAFYCLVCCLYGCESVE